MRQIEPDIEQTFTIGEAELLQTIISVRNERGVFPDEGPTEEDCQNLLRISDDNCSEQTKRVIIQFMLKFGKLYKKDFNPLIERLRRFEEENQNETYRDHICHSFRVWCLGYWLYRKGFNKYFESIGQTKDNFDFVWYLTAFYHDIGYIKEHTYHGGDSAQILLKKLNSSFEGGWSTQAIQAIVAICLHNCSHDENEKINIKKDPYSALLIICDEIQEWGRNIPGNKPRCEINKLQFHMNLSERNGSVKIVMFYPKNQPISIDKLNIDIKNKENDYKKTLSKRIRNLSIKVRCESC